MSGMDRLTDEALWEAYLAGHENARRWCDEVLSAKEGYDNWAAGRARRAAQSAPAPADGLREAVPLGLVEALRSGRQADMDGVMVTVSRQACEMAADILSALTPAPAQEGGE